MPHSFAVFVCEGSYDQSIYLIVQSAALCVCAIIERARHANTSVQRDLSQFFLTQARS